MHEAEQRMHLVVVEMQALPVPRQQSQTPALPIAHDVIRQAGLNSGDDADQTLFDPVLPGDRAGDGFLVGGA